MLGRPAARLTLDQTAAYARTGNVPNPFIFTGTVCKRGLVGGHRGEIRNVSRSASCSIRNPARSTPLAYRWNGESTYVPVLATTSILPIWNSVPGRDTFAFRPRPRGKAR